jgi:hypothetical protein
MARVWYRAVSVLLFRRRRPIGEPDSVATGAAVAATLEGTAGAGRICLALAELGLVLDDVAQAVVDAEAVPEAVRALELYRRFEVVVLGSHLVNLPSPAARRAFLRAAVRHVADGGRVLVEHHPVDWAETAEPTSPTPGATVGMEDVRRQPPFVSAVSTFDIGGRFERQPFTARVLSDGELETELEAAGLREMRRLAPTWVEAEPAPG